MKKLLLLLLFSVFIYADTPLSVPTLNLNLSAPETPSQLVTTLNVVIVLTILALAPSIIFVCTSFLRLVIVFSFMRQAMGTQAMPPNTILISLALVITFFIMQPAANKSYETGIKPYLEEKIGYEEAFALSVKPFKEFMLKNTREKDLALFYRLRNIDNPKSIDDVDLVTLVPAFMISELKTAFEIGFLLYLPFLVIDMVVSSVLMAMGMMMLPPVMISLPFKILIFVLVDGWNLLIGNLVKSFT
ncbi:MULTISPECIES: flagellar type III secretion system pore protein FliP [unclassified Campylobacter]|uniref:flagellar type III secretion system pore protein FliP n=1 Tax=unclassified Campylobacter TaxID=2593542 RepID=UPI001BDA8C32|nr:flagellar type III secretion system pore protein FliP [Campylobacter sp. RM12651]MBT0879161.1 flagellar type III secretion system pore protein FliP [Campylobacter sp. 2018MI01]MBT0881022.1 flagellar type III secretion system pore protein FliP [Campylobacter sp. 2018MI27]MBT0882087.1 flagellar type III secretion system pore protein FliP [Campylobacter sp. 2018MI13]MBT0884507.1 flagellar type III secretion system pore protein FliP [Campylobacter sp. 2018MI10]MBZ7976254.1 flagellar type III se